MEVSIPLIQNQVIDHTGTYRIVQRTVNGQTGLVIEEYIPEPEPEEEVLQNNSNTRAMIIDENNEEEENNNNGQMILRGQNNVRGGDDPTPDPAGEAIEGTFEINISSTPIYPTITSLKSNNTIIADNLTNNNWTYYSGSGNVTNLVNAYSEVIFITFSSNDDFYRIRFCYNMTGSYPDLSYAPNTWVYISRDVINNNELNFLDENNNVLFKIKDNENDVNFCEIFVSASLFNFDGINWMTFN